jgi:hypothetical protein
MTRTAVARLFIVSVSAIGVGIELLFVAGILGSLSPISANGSIMPTPGAYGMVTFGAIGAGLVAAGGLGLLGSGLAALIAYRTKAPGEGTLGNPRNQRPTAMNQGVRRAW